METTDNKLSKPYGIKPGGLNVIGSGTIRHATADDVIAAAEVGNSIMRFHKERGTLPDTKEAFLEWATLNGKLTDKVEKCCED